MLCMKPGDREEALAVLRFLIREAVEFPLAIRVRIGAIQRRMTKEVLTVKGQDLALFLDSPLLLSVWRKRIQISQLFHEQDTEMVVQ